MRIIIAKVNRVKSPSSVALIRLYNKNTLSTIREPSNLKVLKYQLACSKKFVKRGIHQIPKLLVLTLVYHLLGNEASQANYLAVVGLEIDILKNL